MTLISLIFAEYGHFIIKILYLNEIFIQKVTQYQIIVIAQVGVALRGMITALISDRLHCVLYYSAVKLFHLRLKLTITALYCIGMTTKCSPSLLPE